jgi:hypothetical protein
MFKHAEKTLAANPKTLDFSSLGLPPENARDLK